MSDEVPTKSIPERLAVPLTGVSAAAFGLLSALRRNRVFHPVGEAYSGTLSLNPSAANLLPFELTTGLDVTVRFSRGAGLPEPLPDILGLAIKMPLEVAGAPEQDLLLASSGDAPGVRHLLIPAKSFFRPTYSSVLPYRTADDRHLVLGARADTSLISRKGDFGDLELAAIEGRLRFDLQVAEPTGGWTVIGSLEVGNPLGPEVSHALRFNPWNTHPDLQPAGPLNTMRLSSYKASQAARPD